jgi:hypothetical protein
MNLRAEAPTASAECLSAAPCFGPSRMLGCSNNRPVHEVQTPIERALGIGQRLEFGEHASPHAGPLPTAEAAVDGRPLSETFRQVTPWCNDGQNPEDGAHSASVILTRSSDGWLSGRQQRSEANPLAVGQFVSCHASAVWQIGLQALGEKTNGD